MLVETEPKSYRYDIADQIDRFLDGRPLEGYGREFDQEHRRGGRPVQGFLMPRHLIVREKRALDTIQGIGGWTKIVPPQGSWSMYWSAASVIEQAGAPVGDYILGQHGHVQIPLESTPPSPATVAEGAAPGSETNLVTNTYVELLPNTVSAYTDLTRKMWREGSADFWDFIIRGLAVRTAVEMDRLILNGLGTGLEILGLCQDPSIPTHSLGTNGGSAYRSDVATMQRTVLAANADMNPSTRFAWVTSPGGRATLTQTDNASTGSTTGGSGRFVWREHDDTILGKPAFSTTNVPAVNTKGSGTGLTSLVFGAFSDLIVQLFSAVDVLPNFFTQSTTGNIRISTFQDFDAKRLHALAFVKASDLTSS